jgi:5-methyltetrahydropteroyltriglutamate--homocysteine methyltransferase
MAGRRVRTTHVGSLPRGAAVADALLRREHGQTWDRAEFDAAIREHVGEVVDRQLSVGLDVISDGETSKITYSTYVKDRLTGFDGDTPRQPALDLAPYPELRTRLAAASGGGQAFQRQSCVGPIEYVGHDDVAADIATFQQALVAHAHTDGFLNAASPGLVTAFQGNRYFATHEEYVTAVGEAMQVEYEAIVDAGLLLQLDCPDLAMAGHTGFQDLTEREFLDCCEFHVEVLNHATRNIDPSRMRMHLCWGNYEGPHDHDIELAHVLPIVLRARPSTILFEAANPRHAHEWTVWADTSIPDDKVLAPGVITTTSNYVEHPEHVAQLLQRFVDLVGADRVLAGTDCGFGTFAGIGKVDPDVAYKKLAALVAGAALVRV